MRAISVKEPWASMIRRGEKTIETRTWCTRYRGLLLICASKLSESEVSGYAVANLIDCRPMRLEDEEAAGCAYERGRFAWVLEDIRAIDPVFPVRGRLGLFEVPYDR